MTNGRCAHKAKNGRQTAARELVLIHLLSEIAQLQDYTKYSTQ